MPDADPGSIVMITMPTAIMKMSPASAIRNVCPALSQLGLWRPRARICIIRLSAASSFSLSNGEVENL